MKLVTILIFVLIIETIYGTLKSKNIKFGGKHHSKNQKAKDDTADEWDYQLLGTDWSGTCANGLRQSPINIIDGINTKKSEGKLNFKYYFDRSRPPKGNKLKWTGKSIEVEAPIGTFEYVGAGGETEVYEATKIVIHYPSEHYVTLNGQTPRYPLELQIHHSFSSTTDNAKTHSIFKVKNAVVSFLFDATSIHKDGDSFISRMGIDGRQVTDEGKQLVALEGQEIKILNLLKGNFREGLDSNALIYLRNIINYDRKIFRYYGSSTTPPCREDTVWFVFAKPRAINKAQLDFIQAQVSECSDKEPKKKQIPEELANRMKSPRDTFFDKKAEIRMYGTNRLIISYDDALRGKIDVMNNGVDKIFEVGVPP